MNDITSLGAAPTVNITTGWSVSKRAASSPDYHPHIVEWRTLEQVLSCEKTMSHNTLFSAEIIWRRGVRNIEVLKFKTTQFVGDAGTNRMERNGTGTECIYKHTNFCEHTKAHTVTTCTCISDRESLTVFYA